MIEIQVGVTTYKNDSSEIVNQLINSDLDKLISAIDENRNNKTAVCNYYNGIHIVCNTEAQCEQCVFSFQCNKKNNHNKLIKWLTNKTPLSFEYNF